MNFSYFVFNILSDYRIIFSIFNNFFYLKRNWKLMYLDTECLSWTQIKVINDSMDNFKPLRKKMDVVKMLHQFGALAKFDLERYWDAVKSINIEQI